MVIEGGPSLAIGKSSWTKAKAKKLHLVIVIVLGYANMKDLYCIMIVFDNANFRHFYYF